MCESKTCSVCKIDKPVTDFAKHSLGKCGRSSQCGECQYAKEKARASKQIYDPEAGAYKVCSKCGLNKPVEKFDKRPGRPSGVVSSCKSCQAVKNANYREANKNLLTAKLNTAYRRSQDSFIQARRRAKAKGLAFDIDHATVLALFESQEYCPLLGVKLNVDGGLYHSPSLDRIVPKLGYVPGNIQVISFKANSSKQDLSLEQYQRLVEFYRDPLAFNSTRIAGDLLFSMRSKPNYRGYTDRLIYKVIQRAKNRAKTAGVPFDIDTDYLIGLGFPTHCFLTDEPMNLGSFKGDPNSASLDRVIPELGYVKGNVVFVSRRANTAKNDLSLQDMETILRNWKLQLT